MLRHHGIGTRRSPRRERADRDHFEPRHDPRPQDDGPKFGPPRPDLDRGMRGGSSIGEAGAYGPRSDMMEYGGYEPGAYGCEDVESDYNLYSRDAERRDDVDEPSTPPSRWRLLFRRIFRR